VEKRAEVQTWTGRTDNVQLPSLAADFWHEGTIVEGTLEGTREQKMGGYAYKIVLDTPLEIEGEAETEVEIPSLSGIKYALQDLRNKGYAARKGDLWRVACVGVRKAKREDMSDSPTFQIDVIRKAAAAA
jgi:hypothetical protein